MVNIGTSFPGMEEITRNAVRSVPNPLDKSTIVSILPVKIREVRNTTIPSVFIIPPGTYEKPSILVVGPTSWFKEERDSNQLFEIVEGSPKVAESLVNDWCRGLQCCELGSKMPGLFFIPGELTVEQVKKEHSDRLLLAKKRQTAWFNDLINDADAYWSKTLNPKDISDLMRLAAKELGRNDKPWMSNVVASNLTKCPACGSLRDETYPICPNCKAVTDPKKAEALGIKFSG